MKYRIIADYGYGDKHDVAEYLSEEEVISWFVYNKDYPVDCELKDLPDSSDFIYYYREQ